jgi:hypothetical protein
MRGDDAEHIVDVGEAIVHREDLSEVRLRLSVLARSVEVTTVREVVLDVLVHGETTLLRCGS